MADQETRRHLAEIIVEALEVGSGKQERDVIDEIFDAFGINFRDIAAQVLPRMLGFTGLLRDKASSSLAEAAPSAAALLNELVRCGGRFVAMLDEVYDRLARHAATVGGRTAETIRLQRAGVNAEKLTISPAFIERVHSLERRLRKVKIGQIDESAVSAFVGWDGGELYGSWPPRSDDLFPSAFRLADAVLNLAWIRLVVRDRAIGDAAWRPVNRRVGSAHAAAERMVTAAERLVRVRMTSLDMLPDGDVLPEGDAEDGPDVELHGETAGWARDEALVAELRHFREPLRILAQVVGPEQVRGIDQRSVVGLNARLEPVIMPATDNWGGGTAISSLASFVAMWRRGLYPVRPQSARELANDATGLSEWLDRVRVFCDQAAQWLTNDVLIGTRSAEITELVKSVEEFLNLPLWRQRHLLYEVWVLCATLDACEQSSWAVELCGLTRANGIWALSVGPADDPVARLRLRGHPAMSLEVWREPNRVTSKGAMTPDVTISTPAPYRRDLLVVEAKDRQKMSLGRAHAQGGAGSAPPEHRSALGVARRYAAGLRPRATWVCNHCDFRQQSDAAENYGDSWTRIYVAAQFRPGNVPAAFAESVRAALAPPDSQSSSEPAPPQPAPPQPAPPQPAGLVLIVDVTSSMRSRLSGVAAILREQPVWPSFGEFRVILYSDHGANEPFLVRKKGPYSDLVSALDAIASAPQGNGGDLEEALEDALQRCRELAEDIGPQHVLILTDAPPHAVGQCPYQIDAAAELRAMLDSGCHVYLASDCLGPSARTWAASQAMPGFKVALLKDILAQHAG